jgi:hypothetical protein
MVRTAKVSPSQPLANDLKNQATSDLQFVENLTRVLDTQFKIPGTNIRFGADFLMGLVPGAGDLISMAFSGLLISTMAKNGASGMLVTRMLGNVVLDTVVGSVPILGNFFDLFYKANYRNLKLLKEHYHEGKHRGSVWPVVLTFIAVFTLLFFIAMFIMVYIAKTIWDLLSGTSA